MFTLKNFVYSECIPSLGKYLKMWFNQEESGSWRGGVMNRKLEWIGQALNLNWLIAFLEETTQNIKLFYKFLLRLSEPKKHTLSRFEIEVACLELFKTLQKLTTKLGFWILMFRQTVDSKGKGWRRKIYLPWDERYMNHKKGRWHTWNKCKVLQKKCILFCFWKSNTMIYNNMIYYFNLDNLQKTFWILQSLNAALINAQYMNFGKYAKNQMHHVVLWNGWSFCNHILLLE